MLERQRALDVALASDLTFVFKLILLIRIRKDLVSFSEDLESFIFSPGLLRNHLKLSLVLFLAAGRHARETTCTGRGLSFRCSTA